MIGASTASPTPLAPKSSTKAASPSSTTSAVGVEVGRAHRRQVHQLTVPTTTPERRFDHLVSSAGPRPFVTYYDESSGERSELSVRSLANWVAKTHHLLVDELGLGVGDRAALQLPAHWISVPVLLGCLTAGLDLTSDLDDDVAVAFVDGSVAAPGDGALDVYAVNPAKAAVGFGADVPNGTNDYVAAVRPQADTWASVSLTAGADDPCLPGLSRAAGRRARRGTGRRDRADRRRAPAVHRATGPARPTGSTPCWRRWPSAARW